MANTTRTLAELWNEGAGLYARASSLRLDGYHAGEELRPLLDAEVQTAREALNASAVGPYTFGSHHLTMDLEHDRIKIELDDLRTRAGKQPVKIDEFTWASKPEGLAKIQAFIQTRLTAAAKTVEIDVAERYYWHDPDSNK